MLVFVGFGIFGTIAMLLVFIQVICIKLAGTPKNPKPSQKLSFPNSDLMSRVAFNKALIVYRAEFARLQQVEACERYDVNLLYHAKRIYNRKQRVASRKLYRKNMLKKIWRGVQYVTYF